MTARQPWSGSDYDAWLDRGLDKLDDEPMSFNSERAQIDLALAELEQMRKVGHWDEAAAQRHVRTIVDCAEMLPELMDQEARH